MTIPIYHNPWMPQSAIDILAAEAGPILDFGGGASPFVGASHIIDIIPYDPNRLRANAWGGDRKSSWSRSEYTEFDACSGRRWPFQDKAFKLGFTSHTLEDLRDPLPALAELGRVCENLLVITPSRLLEQTANIDHPRYTGFSHHPWMVFQDSGGLVFRRKTAYLMFPGCHFWCPLGRTLSTQAGTFMYHGRAISGREEAFWDSEQEVSDLQRFIRDHSDFRQSLTRDRRPVTFARRVYYWRRRYLGVP